MPNVWNKIFQQLSRLGLPPKPLGHLLKATVVASLRFSKELRAVTAKELQADRVFMNTVVMGSLCQRRLDMHDDQITLKDLYK